MTVSAFERATAIEPLRAGVWRAQCSADWFTPRGPHGGYLAAIVVRALTQAVGDPARAPRSLTVHFLRPPVAGELEVEVVIERSGRSLTTLSTRVGQDGTLCMLGIAAYSTAFPSALDYSPPPPAVRPAHEIEPMSLNPLQPPMARQLEFRPALGARLFSGGDEATTGGWIALREATTVDAALVAMLTDAWMPAPYVRLDRVVGAPTIDLTIHFRVADPAAHVAPTDPVLGVFASHASADGFFDEEGELWSSGGVLLAQSRQLALLIG